MHFYCTIYLCHAGSTVRSEIAAYYVWLLCCPGGRLWDIAALGSAVCRSERRCHSPAVDSHMGDSYTCTIRAKDVLFFTLLHIHKYE